MANGTVRVRMLTNVAGRPSYTTDQVVDLRLDIAKAWIEEGYAVALREEPVETAKR